MSRKSTIIKIYQLLNYSTEWRDIMKRNWMVLHRKELSLTQEEMAERLGISRSYYNQIENGTHTPSGRIALRLSNYYDIEMSKFFRQNSCETQHFKEVN